MRVTAATAGSTYINGSHKPHARHTYIHTPFTLGSRKGIILHNANKYLAFVSNMYISQ